MSRKGYKHAKRGGGGRFVQLPFWLMDTEAWATLKPGPRALYVELKRRFNGGNNGRIVLSHRDAASALGANRNTVGPWFKELERRGFIRMTQGPYLGPSGIGQSAHWALTELPVGDNLAEKTFARWRREKQNPRPKNRTPRPEKQDSDHPETGEPGKPVLKIVT